MRLCLIATGIVLMSVNAQANTQLSDQLSVCASESNDAKRLSCYDNLAIHHNTSIAPASVTAQAIETSTVAKDNTSVAIAPAVTTAVASVNTNTAATETVAPELNINDFGLKKKTIEDEVDRIYFIVKSTKQDPYGKLVVTFDNGQVWGQTSAERYKVKKGQKVFIETGAFNSFLMGSEDRNSTTRVKRLK
ncbi:MULTISPECIES: hypothetical protein [Shewanella]|jgi:hypothetical protein|uniref:hypothetical protein n=1 Tax=Shewanella TaxID=22 RepID=UPI00200F5824|nr:hypothetical protein [Shewanella basaltis]MCL1113383.1 hypothetical protein [Shewanella basaltis]